MNQNNDNFLDIEKSTSILIYIISFGVVVFFLWANFFTLDVLSTAEGEVTPQGEIKSIQHLEGGIVKEILVKAGDEVKRGDTLVILESTSSGADYGEIEVRLAFLRIELEKLKAEIVLNKDLNISKELKENFPRLVNTATSQHKTFLLKYKSQESSYEEVIKQKKSELFEIKARIKNHKKSINILKKQIKISSDLLKEELTNEYTHYDLLRKEVELQTEIDKLVNSIENIKSSIVLAKEQLVTYKQTIIETNKEALKQARQELEQLSSREDKFRDSLNRTVVKSPVDGTIKSLNIYTKGGVVKAGDTIVQIVPTNDTLVIEALLLPQDIGYVKVSQKAFVRLASNDAMKFEKLEGEVFYVSADTFTTEDGASFYKVNIETDKKYFRSKGIDCKLVPGMQVIAYIHIGNRSVLDYVLDPFKSSIDLSLSEK
ncbi:HlyD family type I secretion periplasmic adaptor subunit [Sulfurimonas sp.]